MCRCRSAAGPAVPDVISGVFPHDLSCRSPRGAAALMNYAAPLPELGSRNKCVSDFGGVAVAGLLATLFDMSSHDNSSWLNCKEKKKN